MILHDHVNTTINLLLCIMYVLCVPSGDHENKEVSIYFVNKSLLTTLDHELHCNCQSLMSSYFNAYYNAFVFI